MARGGARNRAGSIPRAGSPASEKKGYLPTVLPETGREGKAPRFPLTPAKDEDGQPLASNRRERAIWRELWTTPQAVQWEQEPWRHLVIAEMCRIQATVELNPGKSAALIAQLHRYRDQCGLTPAGLRDNGWQIGTPQVQPVEIADESNVIDLSARERFKATQAK